MNAAEQQAVVDVWRAEIDNKSFQDDSIDGAVKAWVAKTSRGCWQGGKAARYLC